MKMTNEYFHKYNTRKVEFKNCSGLFLMDGISVGRDYIEDPNRQILSNYIQQQKQHTSNSTTTSSLYSSTPIIKSRQSPFKSILNSSNTSKISETHHSDSENDYNTKITNKNTSTPLYEIIEEQNVFSPPNYYSRIATPHYELIDDHHKAIRNAKVDFFKSIYHDDNHLRNHQETKLVNTTHRLWLPSVKNIKSLENTWNKEVITSIPANKKQLGLTQLRMQGMILIIIILRLY